MRIKIEDLLANPAYCGIYRKYLNTTIEET